MKLLWLGTETAVELALGDELAASTKEVTTTTCPSDVVEKVLAGDGSCDEVGGGVV
jgi:hypothetical protein